jgi:hypothetical protein
MGRSVQHQREGSRAKLRGVGAIAAGIAIAIMLSIVSDMAMQAIGLLPGNGAPSDHALLIATAYRTLYGVLAGYVTARLAPHHPIWHALIGGAIGLIVCVIGAVATWNGGFGPHWYPLALVILAMPQAWLGGRLGAKRMDQAAE